MCRKEKDGGRGGVDRLAWWSWMNMSAGGIGVSRGDDSEDASAGVFGPVSFCITIEVKHQFLCLYPVFGELIG